jgi:hypothetical protein
MFDRDMSVILIKVVHSQMPSYVCRGHVQGGAIGFKGNGRGRIASKVRRGKSNLPNDRFDGTLLFCLLSERAVLNSRRIKQMSRNRYSEIQRLRLVLVSK